MKTSKGWGDFLITVNIVIYLIFIFLFIICDSFHSCSPSSFNDRCRSNSYNYIQHCSISNNGKFKILTLWQTIIMVSVSLAEIVLGLVKQVSSQKLSFILLQNQWKNKATAEWEFSQTSNHFTLVSLSLFILRQLVKQEPEKPVALMGKLHCVVRNELFSHNLTACNLFQNNYTYCILQWFSWDESLLSQDNSLISPETRRVVVTHFWAVL